MTRPHLHPEQGTRRLQRRPRAAADPDEGAVLRGREVPLHGLLDDVLAAAAHDATEAAAGQWPNTL